MKTPPLLLGASLMFWGWQTGLWPIAAIMAVVLEGSRLVKSRLDLSSSDFHRVSDVCTLILLGIFAYVYASNRSAHAIIVIFQWLPMAVIPLVAAQVYSTSDRIAISALFLIFRRKKEKKEETKQSTAINVTYPYFALSILSASAANVRTPWFYVGLFCLSAWALFSIRSKRFSPILWVTLLILTGAGGYVSHIGLHGLQTALENRTLHWFTDFLRKDADPYRATTAIGDMGTMKLSGRIVCRVKTDFTDTQPLLLGVTSYNIHKSSVWFASRAHFKAVQPERDRTTWNLMPRPTKSKIITVSERLRGGKGVLKLPNGAFTVQNLPAVTLKRNRFGSVKVEEGPGLVNYHVHFNPAVSLADPPDEGDLRVPEKEKPAIDKIVHNLDLASKPLPDILTTVAAFFKQGFTYSLTSSPRDARPTLSDFLLRSRSGHCEYFATATVLLLRAAGIPSRYTTGYSLQAVGGPHKWCIVRARHAHAWTSVYNNGRWQNFDTTPPSWHIIEKEAASIFEPLYDFASLLAFKFAQFRWLQRKDVLTKHIGWLLIPLLLLLARRLYSRKRVRPHAEAHTKKSRVAIKPGEDSQFYLIQQKLIDLGYAHYPWEPLANWIQRIEDAQSPSVSTEPLHSILALHYRYRFDPEGITRAEKEELISGVHLWLEQHTAVEGQNPLLNQKNRGQ
jgi:hypothetical protein